MLTKSPTPITSPAFTLARAVAIVLSAALLFSAVSCDSAPDGPATPASSASLPSLSSPRPAARILTNQVGYSPSG